MCNQKEILPLRIVAARFISSDEKEGLAELDRITADVYRLIQWKSFFWWIVFTVMLFATILTLVPGIALSLLGNKAGELLAVIGLIIFFLLMAVLGYWRILQYGSMTANEPQKGIYANSDDPAVRNLERLFTLLQVESTLDVFYLTKDGRRQKLDEHYFFGSLRAAYVAKDRRLKDTLFAPIGFWFSRQIFMEANVADLIKQTEAKPKKPGPKKIYDYTDAVMSLIEHPAIRAMEIGTRGNFTLVTNLLEEFYHGKRVDEPRPSRSQLELHAKVILEVISKNRSANSR